MDYTEIIKNAKEFIESHLSEELSADIISAAAGYSVFHFCRIFKESEGKCLMTYVRDKRLEAAFEEIAKGKSTAEVAEECGFDTASGFARAFKRKYGERPTNKIHA